MPGKYLFVNGMPVLNPDYQATTTVTATTSTPAQESQLTIVSNTQDQEMMADLTDLKTPQQFKDALDTMKSPMYLKKFNTDGIDGEALIEGLSNIFGQYEIPIGLMSKLTAFQGVAVHFKIDNSGSMARDSNLLRRDASSYMAQVGNPTKMYLSRWEEAQDRLHIIIDLLAYVPTGLITLSLFDHPGEAPGTQIVLDRTGITPEEFLSQAHADISRLFSVAPNGGTPILYNMTNMLNQANALRAQTDQRTMHYLLSDGEPNDGENEIRQIKNLLVSKERHADLNPFTFLGCSNQRNDYIWMHELEEIAPFIAVLPDFIDERNEVMRDQGKAFPYNRGFWLLCNVAAAINPDDLDALDQHAPFTKTTLENLLGRGVVEDEFKQYFNRHPNAQRIFGPDYSLFLTEPTAKTIPSVQLFKSVLAQRLTQDIDNNNDNTEDADVQYAEQAVLDSRSAYQNQTNVRPSQYAGSLYYPIPVAKTTQPKHHHKHKGCTIS